MCFSRGLRKGYRRGGGGVARSCSIGAWRVWRAFAVVCLVLVCFWPCAGFAEDTALYKADTVSPGTTYRSVFALTGTQSYITRAFNKSSKNSGFSVMARGGFRIGRWGGFMELGFVGWEGYESADRAMQSSWNFGIGAEVFYFQRRMRTSLAIGASFLYREAPPDPIGTVGAYLDFTPSSYVLRPHRNFGIVIAPLSLFIAVPAFEGIPLVIIQYRTTVPLEFSL